MKIPNELMVIGETLRHAGHPTYLVGGCVRDLTLGNVPQDWDIASSATPDQVLELFEHAHYDNDYGTVRIVNDETDDETVKVVELTTFRKDLGYSDGRRPDNVSFSTNLADDLERRDFTINAMAYELTDKDVFDKGHITDLHGGINDLNAKIIRTVNNPDDRFGEDALRLIRAVRFAAQLGFMIESNTLMSISQNAHLLQNIAVERIADEFNKLIMTQSPSLGMELLYRTGLLEQFIPELIEGVGVEQNQAHAYTVWEHLLRTLQASADKGFTRNIRLASLFHDIAKPATREVSRETGQPTFYNHEVIGASMTYEILKRLKYPKSDVSQITKLVRYHMFFSDPDEITLSAVRRLIASVGPEMIWDLVNLRICDRIGTGRPKEQPYRLRKFKAMIDEASRQPTTVGMLKISGNDLISNLDLKPGRIIGDILHALMNDVLDDPDKNTYEYLMQRAQQLKDMDQISREQIANSGKDAIKDKESSEIEAIRKRHHVE